MVTPTDATPKNFGQPFTCCQPSWTILASMGTRPDTPVRALRRRHDALLTIWLAFLDELDNTVHRARRNASKSNGYAETHPRAGSPK